MKQTNKTKHFSETYLATAGTGKGYGLFKMIADSRGTDQTQIARTIRKMPYQDFMHTRYWHLVALQVKNDAGWRCSRCGSTSNLAVHHDDYKIHGYEMYHFNELQCVCQNCHDSIHGLSKEKKSPNNYQAA